jgi:hypothetical protein
MYKILDLKKSRPSMEGVYNKFKEDSIPSQKQSENMIIEEQDLPYQ